jgi:tripartite-type tricarboxylate transporter receptor subunit TctC
MSTTRKFCVTSLATLVALGTMSACGSGDDGTAKSSFPDGKTVRVIVPYNAGGPNDLSARAVAPCMGDQLKTKVVVENKPGGGGTIGLKEVADSKPDGYTLGVTSASTAVVAPMLAGNAGFTYNDFQPLGLMAVTPSLLVVQQNSKYQTIQALIDAAKAKPGAIKMGYPAAFYEVEMRRLKQLYDINFTMVPFQGTSKAVTALLGGNIDAIFGAADTATMEQVNAKKFKPLATGATETLKILPDVPTLTSLGYDKMNLSDSVIGLSTPAGVPAEVHTKLEDALRACARNEKLIKALGEDVVPQTFEDGTAVEKRFKETHDAFEPVLKK